MIKGKHKRKILAGLKRDRLSGAFDRLSCSKKGKRRMEKLIYKSKYENQFKNKNIARIAKAALNKLPRKFKCQFCTSRLSLLSRLSLSESRSRLRSRIDRSGVIL